MAANKQPDQVKSIAPLSSQLFVAQPEKAQDKAPGMELLGPAQQVVVLCGRLPNGQLAPVQIDPENGGIVLSSPALRRTASGRWAIAVDGV